MPTEADYKVGDVVVLTNNPLLLPDVRHTWGDVTEVHQGSMWGNADADKNRWEYTVDFGIELGICHGVPEGILTTSQT